MQSVAEGRQVILETVETKASDTNRKKQGRGRGNTVSSRGRGSRVNDQTRSQICPSTVAPSNGLLENSYHKVCLFSQGQKQTKFVGSDFYS